MKKYLIGFALIFSFLITFVSAAGEVPLSVLADKINQEQIESIILRGNDIEAVLKDGTHLYSKKEAEISLSESLIKSGAQTEKLKKVIIEFKREPSNVFSVIWPFLPLILFPFIIYGVWFLVFYFLILAGFRILKIERIPKSKIVIYIFAIFILTQLLNPAISNILGDILNINILILINILTSFGVALLLLKYYFLLSGKKLWQFLLYLVVILILSNLVIRLLSWLINALQ